MAGKSVELQNVNEVRRELDRLNKRHGPTIGGKLVGAAMRSFASGIKKQVKTIRTPGRSPKRLKKSVGYRYRKSKRDQSLGKVGFRVGGRRTAFAAPHAHLYILGTKERRRRRIGGKFKRFDNAKNRSTGRAPAHDRIVPDGVASSINKARRNMQRTGEREIQKQRRRGKRK